VGGRRAAARLTANFPPIEDAKATFFGAHGNVVSGAISLAAGAGPHTLLELAGASIVVTAEVDDDNSTAVTVRNDTSVVLHGAQELDGTVTAVSLAAGAAATIPLPAAVSGVHRLHLQFFPHRPQFTDAVTLLISAEHGSIAGQAFASAIE
jgi:hypothetical protein